MLRDQLTRYATSLSDEALVAELQRTERCALCLTRTRREMALMRLSCLRCELERRRESASPKAGKPLPLPRRSPARV
jgi:hypothetical protein